MKYYPAAKQSVYLFLLSLVVIVMIAMFPEICTIGSASKPISMSLIIQMMMLAFWRYYLVGYKN